ncbi:MAG: diguanylate cyclase [Acidimicrobiia bacterium]|jgi:diguanylate cyclase (GGDEF)-like protein
MANELIPEIPADTPPTTGGRPEALEHADLDGPVEIADRIWWVGRYLPGDPFQCHAYLIEHGDQSVLIDPGGPLILDTVLEKAGRVVPFDHLRWFVCHHQDPDITAGLPRLDAMVTRPDAAVISHWRAWALLRHYDIRLPPWLVDEHEWQLDLGGRRLRFVFTPYLHFPGAFTTFDEQTGTLFSSDLFGGFTDNWKLVATDMSYYDEIRPFHEHYMPSREILAAGMRTLERLPITMIAPQHGELIPEPLVRPIIERLKDLDCGLYLMVHQDTDIRRLSQINRMLHEALQQIIVSKDFREVVTSLLELVQQVFPVSSIEFYARDLDNRFVRLAPENRYRGTPAALPPEWEQLLDLERPPDRTELPLAASPDGRVVAVPLFAPVSGRSEAVAVLRLDEPVPFDEATVAALSEVGTPLEVSVERELLMRSVELRRKELYDLAMRDTLTGLHNRLFLDETSNRLFALHDRNDVVGVAVSMFDLDHFKAVNDTFGHAAGDEVLRRFGAVLDSAARTADVVARIGGEEFVAMQVMADPGEVLVFAERVAEGTRNITFDGDLADLRLTVSAGVVSRRRHETFESVVARADEALYDAKRHGRDRIVAR